MINSSVDFESKVKELSRTFCCRLKKSGSVMDCTVKKLSVYKGMMGEKVVLGSLYIPYMEAEIQEFSESLMGDILTAEVGLLIGKNDDGSKNFEYIKMGTFQVSEESYNDGILKIKAVGSLSTKFIGLYISELTYPASVAEIAAELQSQTGVNINFDSDINTTGTVEVMPKGLQRSEMICYLAGLVGGCATEDADGNVVIKRLSSGNTVSMTGDSCTQVPSFSSSYDLTGLRVVTQSSYEDENGNTVPEAAFSYGAPIKMEYSNPFMTQAVFDMFAASVVGYSFNPATVPAALGDPRIEPWDTLSFTDRQGEVYKVPCLNIEHTFDGGFSTKITAPGEESVSESSAQVGPISKMVERTYTKMEAVENMLAGKIEATEVEALYAKISALKATEADIGSAKMDIADINTLLFGSATGKVLQSEFANATIALISDATIDSAKIVSIIADKITSGQLNTNKVNVQSESGQLKITGDTIIIKDTEKTRVQIGKDANNDYNIYILDAEGNIMFDATGVHKSAIKNPIIVDDMVAENANISAEKLDIDSLFSEINGSEKTIKATKVVFDDTGQELSVAFSKIVTDIDGIEEQIQSQGTSMNVLQDKIQSKVWQQDINSTIDNLQIGGRNLLKGTKDCSGFSIYGVSLGVKSVEDESGFKYIEFPTYDSDSNRYLEWIHNYNNPLEIEELLNKEFVLSYEYKTTDEMTDATANMCVEFAVCSDESTIRQVYKLNYLRNTPVNNEWQKITVKGACTKEYLSSIESTVEGAAFENCTRFWVRIYVGPNCPMLNIRKCKLEIGNKATDWTPAPEDIESEVNTKYSEMSTKYSEMVQDLAGFKTTVSETYTTKQEFQNLEIGGRNLIRYTKELPTASEHRGSDGVCLYGTEGDLEPTDDGLKLTFASNDSTALMLPLAYDGCIDNGETLTLSFMYRGNITNTGSLYLLQRETPNVSFNLSSKGSLTANETQWQKFEATFSMPNANEGTCFSLLLFYGLTAYGTDKWIEIKKGSLQLEKGSKATAWTPAPEDIEIRFLSAESSILQQAEEIELKVSKDNIISAINQTAEEITVDAAKVNLAGAINISTLDEELQNSILFTRNLLPNAKTMNGWVVNNTKIVSKTWDDDGVGIMTFLPKKGFASNWFSPRPAGILYNEVKGKQITLSWMARSDDYAQINALNNRGMGVQISLASTTSHNTLKYKYTGLSSVKLSNEWKRYSLTMTLNDDYFTQGSGDITQGKRVIVYLFNYSLHSMQFKKVKLEYGSEATDFDLDEAAGRINNAVTNINALTIFKNSAGTGSETVINGGAIDTDSLFARNITATDLHIKGKSTFEGTGMFEGHIEADSGVVGGWNISGTSLWCNIIPPYDYTEDDLLKIRQYLEREIILTDEEFEMYDINKNGRLNYTDLFTIEQFVYYNLTNTNPGKIVLDPSDWAKPIKLINSSGKIVSYFGPNGASPNALSKISDYIIAQGKSGIWTYQKWNNGKIEAWGNVAATFPASTQMTTYRHRSIYSVSLSSLMTEIIGGSCPYNSSGLIPHVIRNGTTKSTLELMIMDAQSFAGFSATVPVHVIGKWK